MKHTHVFGGILLSLTLIGAGCSYNSTSSDSSYNNGNTTNTNTASQNEETQLPQIISLSATADGGRQVSFDWEIDEDLEEPAKFLLLRSEEKNPKYDGNTYWFRQDGSRRSAAWVNLPPGTYHFRICASDDGESCTIYSNDVLVTIVSGPAPQQQ